MDIIAEGFEEYGNTEYRQFLSIAKDSQCETRSQLYKVYDSEYIDEETLLRLKNEYEMISKKIANFITYLNKKEFQGIKFKVNKTIT